MSATLTTYDGRSYEVSDKGAITIGKAMDEQWQHVHISELNVTIAVKDIRHMGSTLKQNNALPSGKPKFRLPREHDAVMLDADGKLMYSFKREGFYGYEETAKRKAENKIKYMPQWQKDQLEREKKVQEKEAEHRGANELFGVI
jgi:hypothetical protein